MSFMNDLVFTVLYMFTLCIYFIYLQYLGLCPAVNEVVSDREISVFHERLNDLVFTVFTKYLLYLSTLQYLRLYAAAKEAMGVTGWTFVKENEVKASSMI